MQRRTHKCQRIQVPGGFCWHCALRTVGLWLMAVGLIVLVFFVPFWVWPAVLGAALLVIGFMLWKFC